MPTLTFCCGFDEGLYTDGPAGVDGSHDMVDTGNSNFSSARARAGGRYCINPINISVTTTIVATRHHIGSVWFRRDSGVVSDIIQFNPNNARLRMKTGGTIQGDAGGGTLVDSSNGVLSISEWHLLEWHLDTSANPSVLKWRVDGVAQSDLTFAIAAYDLTSITFRGDSGSDVNFDDAVFSHTAGDYPLGEYTVLFGNPDADGTHSFTLGNFQNESSTNIATTDTTTHNKVKDPDSQSTYVKQVTIASGEYLEWVPTQQTSHQRIDLVYMAGGVQGAAIGTDSASLKALIDGAESVIFTGHFGPNGWGTRNKYYLVRPNTSAWDHDSLNAVRFRFGYATDVTPVPLLADFWYEAASKDDSVLDFTGTPLTGTAPLPVVFTSSPGEAPLSYFWDFGDGSSSTDANPTHVYVTPGTFTVSLTAIYADWSTTVTKDDYVVVSAPTTPVAGTLPSIEYWVDWGKDGWDDPLDDITGDVQDAVGEVGGAGDFVAGQNPGTFTIYVTNLDGKYNPDNASSPLFGLLEPMRPVWVGGSSGATNFGVFAGYVKEVVPVPGRGATKAQILCFDPLGRYQKGSARVEFAEGRPAHAFRRAILNAVGEVDARIAITDEVDVLQVSGVNQKNALSALESLNQATGTRHWVQPAATKEEWYFYRTVNRNDNLGGDFKDTINETEVVGVAGYRRVYESIVNSISVTVHHIIFDRGLSTVAKLDVPFPVSGDKPSTLFVDFQTWVKGATLHVTLESGTLTTQTITNYGQSARIDLAAASDVLVTSCYITGYASVDRSGSILAVDTSVVDQDLVIEGSKIDSDYIGSSFQAQAVGDAVIFRQKTARAKMSITMVNRFDKLLLDGLYDVIAYSEPEIDLDAKRMEIIGIHMEIKKIGTLWTWGWTLLETPVQEDLGIFTLDVSELDDVDVLGI